MWYNVVIPLITPTKRAKQVMRVSKSTQELVKKHVEWINSQLASCISQDDKSLLCTCAERLLHDAGMYKGYNHLYWIKQGHKEWEDAGKPNFPTKNCYITGVFTNNGIMAGPQCSSDRGEFSREYYV